MEPRNRAPGAFHAVNDKYRYEEKQYENCSDGVSPTEFHYAHLSAFGGAFVATAVHGVGKFFRTAKTANK